MSTSPPLSKPHLPKKPSQSQLNVSEEGWEDHLVIRFPPELASEVEKFVSDEAHASDRLSINFDEDLRGGSLKFDEHTMQFRVCDLPTIIEVMKTIDKKTAYKVADISQLVVCTSGSKEKPRDGEEGGKTAALKWPHGLCPPMRNARTKMFRKMKRKKFLDQTDVERELKRLLRADQEAEAFMWEIVACEEDEMAPVAQTTQPQELLPTASDRTGETLISEKVPGPDVAKNEGVDVTAALWDLDDSLSLSDSSEEEEEPKELA